MQEELNMMDWTVLGESSTNIEKYAVCPNELEGWDLYVRFHAGGTYLYSKVRIAVLEAFEAAKSKGSYLATVIKTQYKGIKVGE